MLMKKFGGRAFVDDPCSSPSGASTAMLASLDRFPALADCSGASQAAALPSAHALYGKQHSEGLREVQDGYSSPRQQQFAGCSEQAPRSPSYTGGGGLLQPAAALAQVPCSPSEAATCGAAAAEGRPAVTCPPQTYVHASQLDTHAVLPTQGVPSQCVITSAPGFGMGTGGTSRPSCPQERLPASWADVSWLDGLSFPDLFAEGDFALALPPPQEADRLFVQLPYPAPAEAPLLESATSLVSSSSASGTPAASSPAGSLPNALPALPFWPSTPGSEKQIDAGGFPADAGSSWVTDLAAAAQGLQPQQAAAQTQPLAAAPGPGVQADSRCCGAEASRAGIPALPAVPASGEQALGGPASGMEPGAVAKGTGRKRGRPRLYDTAGAPAATAAPSGGGNACSPLDLEDGMAQQSEHGKRGRGPKPKYVFGSRVEAAGARRERNRKAALDSYYRQRQHVKELEEERDRLLAENSSLEGLLGHLQLGGPCPLTELNDAGIDAWLAKPAFG